VARNQPPADRRHVGSDYLLLAVKRWKAEVEGLRKIEKALREAGVDFPRPSSAKLPGDPRAMRGIPLVGQGISGAIRGSRPGDGLDKPDRER